MWSPQITGVDPAGPGRASRQATFSVLLQESGRSVSWLIPSNLAPRHCGQFSARPVAAKAKKPVARATNIGRIIRFAFMARQSRRDETGRNRLGRIGRRVRGSNGEGPRPEIATGKDCTSLVEEFPLVNER